MKQDWIVYVSTGWGNHQLYRSIARCLLPLQAQPVVLMLKIWRGLRDLELCSRVEQELISFRVV